MAIIMVFVAGGLVTAAFQHTFAQPAAAPATQAPEPIEEPGYAARTTPDRIGRIMAPVLVNGRGPYAFIVDSGARDRRLRRVSPPISGWPRTRPRGSC